MVLGGEGPRIQTYSYLEGECASYAMDSMREMPTTSKGWGTSMECDQGAFAEVMNHAVSNRLDLFTWRQFAYICRGRASAWKHTLMF